ncbi:MAG: methyltransferase domain-containing protein [Actinomycetota bacterium]
MIDRTRHRALGLAKTVVPARRRSAGRDLARRLTTWPPVGLVRFGSLRRTTPIAPMWPPRYGRPIDRHYIDRFLEAESACIRGDVLEVGDIEYTKRFGSPDVVSWSSLHSPIGAGPGATYVADLVDAPELPDAAFDCILLPQTLLFIYDVAAAVATLYRTLRPGGVVLVTVPGITQSVPDDKEQWGQYWSFTDDSLRRLFGDVFGPDQVEINAHGNVFAAVGFLHGLVVDDVRRHHLDVDDPAYPLILTVKARRSPA